MLHGARSSTSLFFLLVLPFPSPWTPPGARLSGPRKKPSLSTLRRNARRREEFNAKITSGVLLPSPEKERCSEAPAGLQMSPTHLQREENVLSEQEEAFSPASTPPSPSSVASPATSPPPPSLRYRCNKYMCTMTFTSEDDLRVHFHEYHSIVRQSHVPSAVSQSYLQLISQA